MNANRVLDFWFIETGTKNWFAKNEIFDQHLMNQFGEVHQAAAQGELYSWRVDVRGRLAEIIILDQFSRNLYRDKPQAFANDTLALCLAQEAVDQKLDENLNATEQAFLYMPYMHSESALIHDEALRLFAAPGLESNYRFEKRHKEAIDKFGRYPHRNAILGRVSTQEELSFLSTPGSSF
ncbi:MAG: hypothetical protein ACJAR0_003557 [Candidatus Azotimanducaceae bacterium]|jgi:uncharacterized protein (DUF924 family)